MQKYREKEYIAQTRDSDLFDDFYNRSHHNRYDDVHRNEKLDRSHHTTYDYYRDKSIPPEYQNGNAMLYGSARRRFYKRRGDNQEYSGYNTSRTSEKSVKSLSSQFAERTSLQGVPLINNASRWYRKAFWSIVFILATGAFTGHAYYIISTYISFGTSTKVSIKHKHVEFPSITLCNINPLRKSVVQEQGTPDLIGLLNAVEPINVNKYANGPPQQPQPDPPTPDPGTTPFQRRKLLQSESDYAYAYQYAYYNGESDFSAYQNPINWTAIANQANDFNKVFLDNMSSSYAKVNAALQEFTSQISDANRTKLGHNFTTMLLSCSFDGMACSAKNFSRTLDIEYGNCWTFNSAHDRKKPLVSKLSGAKFGLDLILFIDDAEYLTGFQLGRGIRLQIHQFKTMPFVSDHGMSLKPGQEAFIAFRLTNQTRLGGKYGACDDNGQYKAYYNNTVKYTLLGCINTCLERTISSQCKCYRRTKRQFYSVTDLNKLKPCTSANGACITKLNTNFLARKLDCGCKQACHTSDYDSNESYNEWPETALWNALIDSVCTKDPTYCYNYFNSFETSDFANVLGKNFLHLKIYFKELNVQSIDEVPDYPAPQFASDLGGAIGLWIGATFITIMEIFEFIYELSTLCCCCKKKSHQKSHSGYSDTSNNMLRDPYRVNYF